MHTVCWKASSEQMLWTTLRIKIKFKRKKPDSGSAVTSSLATSSPAAAHNFCSSLCPSRLPAQIGALSGDAARCKKREWKGWNSKLSDFRNQAKQRKKWVSGEENREMRNRKRMRSSYVMPRCLRPFRPRPPRNQMLFTNQLAHWQREWGSERGSLIYYTTPIYLLLSLFSLLVQSSTVIASCLAVDSS